MFICFRWIFFFQTIPCWHTESPWIFLAVLKISPYIFLKPLPVGNHYLGHMWHHLDRRPCRSRGTPGSVDTSLNNTCLFLCVKHCGLPVKASCWLETLRSIMLKYVSFSIVVHCAWVVAFCAAEPVSASPGLAPSLQLWPHYVWQRFEKAGGIKGEKGGGLAEQRSAFSSSWYHGWINWCCFVHFFCWPNKIAREKKIFGQLPVAWQLEFEFSSLCHYYFPPFPSLPSLCSSLLWAHSQRNLCIHSLSRTHPLPSKMHLSPVELWH